MKKVFGISAVMLFSLSLFSFSTKNQKVAQFNEVKKSDFKTLYTVGSFTKYQKSCVTSDETTWSYRYTTWSLTNNDGSLDQIEKALK